MPTLTCPSTADAYLRQPNPDASCGSLVHLIMGSRGGSTRCCTTGSRPRSPETGTAPAAVGRPHGAKSDLDRIAAPSASLLPDWGATAQNAYITFTGPAMLTDLGARLASTAPNYGWLIVCDNEHTTTQQQANNRSRTASAPAQRPEPLITYLLPAAGSKLNVGLGSN